MTTYFGQHGEDCLLSEFFKDESTGVYVDFGAFDGKHLSNTYIFDKLGWSGVCVEADTRYFNLCEQGRTAICINAACVGDPNITEIAFMCLDQPAIGSRLVSCLHNIRPANKKRFTFTEIKVPAISGTRSLVRCYHEGQKSIEQCSQVFSPLSYLRSHYHISSLYQL